MSKIGESAYPIDQSKTHGDERKNDAVNSSVDEDIHHETDIGGLD
jgi:hypothetical protein